MSETPGTAQIRIMREPDDSGRVFHHKPGSIFMTRFESGG